MSFPLRSLLVAMLALVAAACGRAEALLNVTVGGTPLPLHEFRQGEFGLMTWAGPVDVEIKADFNVRWVDVRPRSAGITAEVLPDHRTVRFRLTEARPITVEFNRDLGRVLHLFPAAPDQNPPAAGAPHVVYFGPGVHEPGLIELKSGDTLYLAAGAWVKGSVRSVGTRDVTIRGRGVLDGGDIDRVAAERRAAAGAMPAYAGGNDNVIYFQDVEHAAIEGITIVNSNHWTVYTRSCRDLHVDGVNILNQSVHYGNDGFDVVSSSDVLIENVFVRTNDDCVVVKNLDDIPTHHIEVRRGTFWNMPVGGNALEIGFELRSHGVSDISFSDCDILHVERGSAISIHEGDSGTVSDVRFDNIRVEDARRKLIDFCVLFAQYGVDRPATEEERQRRMDPGGVWDGEQRLTPEEYRAHAAQRGHIKNVRVHNLHVVEGSLPYSVIAGYDEQHRVDDVVIDGLEYLGRPLRTAAEAKLVTADVRNVVVR